MKNEVGTQNTLFYSYYGMILLYDITEGKSIGEFNCYLWLYWNFINHGIKVGYDNVVKN